MIRALLLPALFFTAAGLWGCATQDRSAENIAEAKQLLEEGRDAAMRNDHPRAVTLCTMAVKVNPDLAEAWYERGKSNIQLRLSPKAEGNTRTYEQQSVDDFTMALQKNPAYADAYFNRAMILSSRAQYKPAIEDLLNASRYKPRDPDAHLYLARLYETKFEDRVPMAMDHYEKYTDLGGTDPEAREKARVWKEFKKGLSTPQAPTTPPPSKTPTAEDERKAAELHGKALELLEKSNKAEGAKLLEELLGPYGHTKYVQEKLQGLRVLLSTLKKKDAPK